MNLELLTFILANTITGTIFFNYLADYIKQEHQEKLDFLLHKINSLEAEITELHETLDVLEEGLHKKHIDMRVSHEQLGNKIDSFIVRNYDITN
jgi:predicted  nucleic acid-binding Zn-ribbon protein